ncbi:MAG: transcription antitermination protein NusB [bacterium]|nr:transcription antitermination protein NusB [bacterium]
MKSRNDPRHQRREHLIQILFEWEFRKNSEDIAELQPIIDNLGLIDTYIRAAAPQWPLDQIAPVDLAILRHGVWEMLFAEQELPEKVVLDESIELAKEYGGDSSPSFINGVLGTVLKDHRRETTTVTESTT